MSEDDFLFSDYYNAIIDICDQLKTHMITDFIQLTLDYKHDNIVELMLPVANRNLFRVVKTLIGTGHDKKLIFELTETLFRDMYDKEMKENKVLLLKRSGQ